MSDLKDMNVGIEDFQKIIKTNPSYYVDKTSFIKQLSKENVALFTRPRRFGKTLTMSMLKYFFEMNYENPSDISAIVELFKDLDISKDTEFCKKYMGQYPVVSLTLKDVVGSTYSDTISNFADKFYSLWNKFEGVIKNNNNNLSQGLKRQIDASIDNCFNISQRKFLSTPESDANLISKTLILICETLFTILNKKVIVIIDEYDVPLKKSRGKYYRQMVEFVKSLFSVTFKTNDFLEKGYLTGCLRVSRESIFTGLNNIPVYDCSAEKYSTLFGFTNEDVKQMLEYYNLSKYFNTIKEWYDGYEIGVTEIYNPFSVSFYVDKLLNSTVQVEPDCAWKNSSSNDFLTEFVDYLPEQDIEDFKSLLNGNIITKELNTTLNYGDLEKREETKNLWTMLYFTGYLTKVGTPTRNGTFELRIPNEEVKDCFNEKIKDYFSVSPVFHNKGKEFLLNLMDGSARKAINVLNELLPKYLGLRDVSKNHEDVYHSFLIGLLSVVASNNIKVKSQKEKGDGYPDIVIEVTNLQNDGDTVIILELKRAISDSDTELDKQCQIAITQCHDKNYYRDYVTDRSVKNIYLYGLAFCNRSCKAIFEDVSDKIKKK